MESEFRTAVVALMESFKFEQENNAKRIWANRQIKANTPSTTINSR